MSATKRDAKDHKALSGRSPVHCTASGNFEHPCLQVLLVFVKRIVDAHNCVHLPGSCASVLLAEAGVFSPSSLLHGGASVDP